MGKTFVVSGIIPLVNSNFNVSFYNINKFFLVGNKENFKSRFIFMANDVGRIGMYCIGQTEYFASNPPHVIKIFGNINATIKFYYDVNGDIYMRVTSVTNQIIIRASLLTESSLDYTTMKEITVE